MTLFLFLYLTIYGGMNGYMFLKLLGPLRRLGGWAPGLALLWLAFMVAGPILARYLERTDMVRLAQVVGAVTYTWMALALWFFVLGLAADAWNGAWGALQLRWPAAGALRLHPDRALLAVGGLVALAAVWGAIEAHWIRVERITIATPRLAPDADPIIVAHVSDLHLGLIERDGRLAGMLRILEHEAPDLLVATGDMVDGSAHHMEHLAEMLARYRPPLGKFAVLGNHEWYVGSRASADFLRDAGFEVLRGESAAAGDLLLVGVDDPAGLRRGVGPRLDEDRALPAPDEERPYTVLLKHRPWVETESLGRFDLQLSGHTHGGQIFPFGFVVRMQYEYMRGLYPLAEDSWLYVNRGTGTWGPRLRLGSPPEVTLIRIEPGRQSLNRKGAEARSNH